MGGGRFHGHEHAQELELEHGHTHAHGPADFGFAFALGVALNIALVIAQVVFGLLANSMALLADAGHNFSDVIALVLAWGATALSRRPPNGRYTYGLRSSTILAALSNGLILLLVTGGIAWEAVLRLATPEPVEGVTVIAVAAVGVVINGGVALLFMRGRHGDMNVRAAFLHMAADAAISAGVVATGAVILLTGVGWLDSVVSLAIAATIVWGTWGLLRDATDMALHAAPANIDIARVREMLGGLPGVAGVHDLHVWSMSTTETALTCHLVTPAGHPGDAFLAGAAGELRRAFGIHHSTLQIELGDAGACELESDHVV